ncbi:MAG: hypothetical protein ACNA8R_05715 [Nitriliruptoraceae bacterium]
MSEHTDSHGDRAVIAIRVVAAAGCAMMTSTIVAAFSVASFTEEGGLLLELAWGRVTLIDIYLAFLFGWLWIAWRERSPRRAALWAVATVVTGSVALFAYLLGASLRARTSTEVVLGPHRRRSTD